MSRRSGRHDEDACWAHSRAGSGGQGGTSATFSIVFRDPNGWAAIANAEVPTNTGRSPQAGCYIGYLPASGTFQLLNDAGTKWSSTALSNGQRSLPGATASGVGNNLTLTLPVTFKPRSGW